MVFEFAGRLIRFDGRYKFDAALLKVFEDGPNGARVSIYQLCNFSGYLAAGV
jgi:hypothetical protein